MTSAPAAGVHVEPSRRGARTSAPNHGTLVGVIERVADTRILAPRIHGASPTELACGACGNTAGNRQIYYGWTTEPNADRKWNQEVRCDACGKHSLHVELHPARADRVSDAPNVAAADHESQPYRHQEDDLTDVRTGGPGWPTTIPCGACGNVEGNLAVWYSWWCSRNGDATENDEVRCGACRKYSLYIRLL